MTDEADVRRLAFDYADAIDRRDWVRYRSLLSDRVDVALRPGDGVGFVGLGAQRVPMLADVLTDRNRTLFAGIARTSHKVANVRVDVEGDLAVYRAIQEATNFVADAGESECTVGETYVNHARRTRSGWKIFVIDLTVNWERGDSRLFEEARQIGRRALAVNTRSSDGSQG
ncbi:nuclear transport factor 2 family protein [Microbacterium sp. NPDC055357]